LRPGIGRILAVGVTLAVCWLAGQRCCAQQTEPAADVTEGTTTGDDSSTASKQGDAGNNSTSPSAPASRIPAVEEVGPEVYWLPDAEGQLQPVLNWPFEAFIKLRELEQGLATQQAPPPFTILSLDATVQVRDQVVEFDAEVEVQVNSERWVRIPLRFDQATMRGGPSYEGSGEHIFAVDPNGGFVAWLQGKGDKPHRLKLPLLMRADDKATQNLLEVELPLATTSRVAFEFDKPGIEVETTAGVLVERSTTPSEVLTKVDLLGARGHLEVRWKSAEAPALELPLALEASGRLLIRIDGRSVSTVAELQVTSRGRPIERFRVRLPEKARLVAGTTADYQVNVVEDSAAAETDRTVLEIQLTGEPRTEVNIRLVTEQPHDPADTQQSVDLVGFEIVDAVRQAGHVAVATVGDWQLVWGRRKYVRQVATDELPETMPTSDLNAAFEYLNQPAELQVRVTPRRSRVGVEPQYVFLVDGDQVTLHARLKYTIRGARVFALQWRMPQALVRRGGSNEDNDEADQNQSEAALIPLKWEVRQIGPPNLVDLQDVSVAADEPNEPASIALLQPAIGEVELLLDAVASLPPDTDAFSVVLQPQPVNSAGPASVVVVPADNVELRLNQERTDGLSRATATSGLELPLRQQPAMIFRGQPGGARFSATFRRHEREVGVRIESRIELTETETKVQQRLIYDIQYEPMDRIPLIVPQMVADAGGINARVGGQSVSLHRADHANGERGADGPRPTPTHNIDLTRSRIGNLELTINYSLPPVELPSKTDVALNVPLIVPAEAEAIEHRAQIVHGNTLRVLTRNDDWQPVGGDEGEGPDQLVLSTTGRELNNLLRLVVSRDDTPAVKQTLIDRLWIQSWVGRRQRQDRVALRCTTASDHLLMELPAGADDRTLELLLDGNVATTSIDDRTLRVDLSRATSNVNHLIELRYRWREPFVSRRALELSTVAFGDDVIVRNTYWQVIMPSERHLIASSPGFHSEQSWVWRTFRWAREPNWRQYELESWVGTPHRTAPSRKTNQYLFSSLGLDRNLEVFTVERWVLVLAASGLALVLGLILIHTTAGNRTALLLCVSLSVAAVGILYPDATILISQAAIFGFLLVIASRLLQRGTNDRPTRPSNSPASSLIERGSSTPRRVLSVGSDDPTSTRHAALQGSASSSK